VARRGDPVAVDPAGETGDGRLDGVELVEHAGEVGDALGPDRGEDRVVEPEPVPPRVEVRGLDDDEAARCPERGQGRVPVEVPAVAVREHDDRQVASRGGCRHADLEGDSAPRGRQGHRRDGDDRVAGADDVVQGDDE